MTWLLVVWLAGGLLIVLVDAKLDRLELLSLAAWPVIAPTYAVLRLVRRRRFTCRDCGGYYGDREHYRRHLALSHNGAKR